MKKNQSLEVLEPEVEEIPLEQVINNSLVKHNVTDAVIASLKDKYGALRLNDIEDKESYLEIKEARKEVRKVGILVEKLCKKGREDAVAIQRKWLAKEKEVLAKVSEVEDPLNSEIEKFENEVERKELLEAKKREETYIGRQSTLLKYGAQYNNGSLELKHISYEVELIKQADDEQWNDTILPKYKKVYEEIEAVRVEEENKRKAEMDRLKLEQDKFVEEQRLFTQQREEFSKQQKALQEQKDEVERQQRLEKEKQEAIKKQIELDLFNSRLKQLNKITWNGVTDSYHYYGTIITRQPELLAMSEDEFISFRDKHNATVEADIKIAEEKRLAQIEKEKQEAIQLAVQQEREKIAEQQRQIELTKQREEANRQQRLAESNDKTKWECFLNLLATIQFPTELKSSIYKSKLSIAKEKISEIKDL
jgi:hypothetical protein